MKKVILSLALLAGLSATAHAQATFGLKAGGSYTSFTGDQSDTFESRFGFHGGLVANLAVNDMFSIQPEVLYSMKGADQKIGDAKFPNRLGYVDIPVMLQVNADGLFFEAGPQLGILVSAKHDMLVGTTTVKDVDFKADTETIDFGYAVGLGYKVDSGPMVGLRYNGGITDFTKADNVSRRNSAFQLYVGYMFGGR
jgi:hypothetical protein